MIILDDRRIVVLTFILKKREMYIIRMVFRRLCYHDPNGLGCLRTTGGTLIQDLSD